MQLGFPAMTAFGELYVWAWEGYCLQPPSTQAMATAPFAAKGLASWKKQATWKWHYTCLFRSGASGLRNTTLDSRPVLGIRSGRKREPNLSGGVTAHNSKSKGVISSRADSQTGLWIMDCMLHWLQMRGTNLIWADRIVQCSVPVPCTLPDLRPYPCWEHSSGSWRHGSVQHPQAKCKPY